eukprot:TRINITY_DN2567_c0_g1_i16.p1 TRINITY_DN2567_c0_g1~~TRINITY_DN2567_c0_g1_i16.p1  ORF type:complete len:348 (+),score=63.64 TRINITY_DN2567_c0_g1_i16:127-1170(+)
MILCSQQSVLPGFSSRKPNSRRYITRRVAVTCQGSGKGFGDPVEKQTSTNVKKSKRGTIASRTGIEQMQQMASEYQTAQQQQQQNTETEDYRSVVQEVPQGVTDRMLKRIFIFTGIPVLLGFLLYPAFYYLKVVMKVDVPMWSVYITQLFTFGGGALGITSPGLTFVHGRRAEPAQPNIPRFRAAARKAAQFVAILHSEAQACSRLAGSLPVVIQNEGWEEIAEEVDDIVLGDAEVWRRPSEAKPDISPSGGDSPYVSPEGHAILDVRYGQRKQPNGPQAEGEFCLFGDHGVDYNKLDAEIMGVSGTVMTGLLSDVASHVAICGGEEVKIFDKASLTAATAQSTEEE